jgi:hypothetical protein
LKGLPVATHIGKISYSLYLWHWPIYVLMRWTVGLASSWQFLLAFALSVLFAEASYHLIELPIRRNRWSRRRSSWRTVVAGLAMILISHSAVSAIFRLRPQLSQSVTRDEWTWYPEPWPDPGVVPKRDLAGRRLFAIGDSHVGAYATMLQRLSAARGIQVISYFAGGCPVASLVMPAAAAGRACAGELDRYLREIERQSSPGDIVLLASLRVNRFADEWAVFPPDQVAAARDGPEAARRRQLALDEAVAIVQRFQRKGLTVILDAPTPVFRSPIFRCVDWFNRNNPICRQGTTMDRRLLLKHRAPVMRSLAALQTRAPGVRV